MSSKSDVLIKFGRRIRSLRLQKGFTSQMDFAYKAGLDRTYIGGIERGERNVSLKNLARLADTLHVDLDELMRF